MQERLKEFRKLSKVDSVRIDEVFDKSEDNDRELIRDFTEYTNQALKTILVFRLKIDKMQEVNRMILEPVVGVQKNEHEKRK